MYIDKKSCIITDILLKDESGRVVIVELKINFNPAKSAVTQILSYYYQIKDKFKGSVMQSFVFIVLSTVWPQRLIDALEVLIDHDFPIIPINIDIKEESGEIIDFKLNFLKIRERRLPWNSFSSEHFRGVHIGWNNKEDVNITTRDFTDYAQLILEKHKIGAIMLELNGNKNLTVSSDGTAIFVLNPSSYRMDNLEEILERYPENASFLMNLIYRIDSINSPEAIDSSFHFITDLIDIQTLDIYSMLSVNKFVGNVK